MTEKTISQELEGAIFEGMKTVLSPLTALGRFFSSPEERLRNDIASELINLNKSVDSGTAQALQNIKINPSTLNLPLNQQAIAAPAEAVSTAVNAPSEGQIRQRLSRQALANASPLIQVSQPGLALRGLFQDNARIQNETQAKRQLEQQLGFPEGALESADTQTLQTIMKTQTGNRLGNLQSQQQGQTLAQSLQALAGIGKQQQPIGGQAQQPQGGSDFSPLALETLGEDRPLTEQERLEADQVGSEFTQEELAGAFPDLPAGEPDVQQPQQSGQELPPAVALLQKMMNDDPELTNKFLGTEQGQELFKSAIGSLAPSFDNILKQNKFLLDMQKFSQSQREFDAESDIKKKQNAINQQKNLIKEQEIQQRKELADLDAELDREKLAVSLQIQNMKNQAALAKIEASKGTDVDKQANILRKEYIKADKDHQDRVGFYQQTIGALEGDDETGVSDIALIFTFMKMLDPRSVVRETEQGMVVDSAGLEPKARNLIESVLRGKKLSDPVRGNILNRVNKLHEKSLEIHSNTVSEYSRLSKEFGVPESKVIVGTFGGFDITDVPEAVLKQSPELKQLAIKQLKRKLGEE